MRVGPLLTAAAVAVLIAGCSGADGVQSSSTPLRRVDSAEAFPDFYDDPPAQPEDCPPDAEFEPVYGEPWPHVVDISVFLVTPDPPDSVVELLQHEELVEQVYLETQENARKLFTLLFTCSAGVASDAFPASLRVNVVDGATPKGVEDLARELRGVDGVEEVRTEPRNGDPARACLRC